MIRARSNVSLPAIYLFAQTHRVVSPPRGFRLLESMNAPWRMNAAGAACSACDQLLGPVPPIQGALMNLAGSCVHAGTGNPMHEAACSTNAAISESQCVPVVGGRPAVIFIRFL